MHQQEVHRHWPNTQERADRSDWAKTFHLILVSGEVYSCEIVMIFFPLRCTTAFLRTLACAQRELPFCAVTGNRGESLMRNSAEVTVQR